MGIQIHPRTVGIVVVAALLSLVASRLKAATDPAQPFAQSWSRLPGTTTLGRNAPIVQHLLARGIAGPVPCLAVAAQPPGLTGFQHGFAAEIVYAGSPAPLLR